MAELAYSIEDAANDLNDAPGLVPAASGSVPATYDPGTLDSDTSRESRSHGGLTVEQAADLIDDDGSRAGGADGAAVAYHNGHPLTLSQLAQGFTEGMQLLEVQRDLDSRYRWVQQAGQNVYAGASAVAELIASLFPPPNADMSLTDPVGYLQAKAVHDEVHNAAKLVTQYAQGVAQENADWARAQVTKDSVAFEASCFLEAFPQATNPEWGSQFVDRITKVAEHCGYHASELGAVTDHRVFKVLDIAASALEKQQGTRREAVKSSKPKPRLVASGGSLTMSEAMAVDFD